MPTLEILSTDEIRDRRAHLLVQAGLSEGELRRRADDYSLTREQAVILDRIADLDFLLEAHPVPVTFASRPRSSPTTGRIPSVR